MSVITDFNIKEELTKLPKKPGVYLMHGTVDEIIYVGKAINLYNRVHQYFQNPESKSATIRKMISLIRRFEYIVVESELEALVLENNLIKENRPKYNTLLKDDKTYPFIKATVSEAYPRIFMTRKFRIDKDKYYGPYTSVNAVRDTLNLLHKIYQIRTCHLDLPKEAGKNRPCLNYHMGQCLAPCTGSVSCEEYARHFQQALDFLNGKYGPVKEYLSLKMQKASESLAFEDAANYRDLLTAVDELKDKQKVTSTTDENDRDVIGIAAEGEDAVAQVFFIRKGVMIGREKVHLANQAVHIEKELQSADEAAELITAQNSTLTTKSIEATKLNHTSELDNLNDSSMSSMVSAFVNRFYTGTPFIPQEILLQIEISDKDLVERWLSQSSGHRCRITVPKAGQHKKLVDMAIENAKIALHQDSDRMKREEVKTLGANAALRDTLGLNQLHRIESFDISNTNGFEPVGSMVVYTDGRPLKSDYRKFRIQSVEGPNDVACMAEVLKRRFAHVLAGDEHFGRCPDLILMDGGAPQVGACETVIKELGLFIPVAGMVKDEHHRTRALLYQGKELPMDIHGETFQLLTRIQDETHRFAIEYHKSLRSKKQTHSMLDDIPGIGPKRKLSLLHAYPSMQLLSEATEEELALLPGMDQKSAKSVYLFLHK